MGVQRRVPENRGNLPLHPYFQVGGLSNETTSPTSSFSVKKTLNDNFPNTVAPKTVSKINKAKKSSILIGEVEDVPVEEWDGDRPDSIWNNRRPCEGNWMEPVEGFIA